MNIRVEDVLIIDEALLAVGLGVVIETGERVPFALTKERARSILEAIARGGSPTVDVDPAWIMHRNVE